MGTQVLLRITDVNGNTQTVWTEQGQVTTVSTPIKILGDERPGFSLQGEGHVDINVEILGVSNEWRSFRRPRRWFRRKPAEPEWVKVD